jgi:hypothetical protein
MNDTTTDQSCQALAGLTDLDTSSLHRFIVGRDSSPVAISPISLNDPFSQLVLRELPPPRTADEVVRRLQTAVGQSDPRAFERSFLVGEGSQLPVGAIPFNRRTIRFVVALGKPVVDVILSAFSPGSQSIELMAWDSSTSGFNYYRTAANGAWVFGGNSMDAIRIDTEGKGPFESHTGGNVLMKELEFPWVHWHSLAANAPLDRAVMEGHLQDHRWLRDAGDEGGTLLGAEDCETEVVKPSIDRWSAARMAAVRDGREPFRLKRLIQHVLTSATVNLVSSPVKSADASGGAQVDLPAQFFLDSESLVSFLGATTPPSLAIPADVFEAVNQQFGLRLADHSGFQQLGDTFFAFVVPGRAFEDVAIVKAVADNIVTRRLVASLLMVDFPNPIFSKLREQLLDAVPEMGDPGSGPEQTSQPMAEAIVAIADEATTNQFLSVWDAGDDWLEAANSQLTSYYARLVDRLEADPFSTYGDWLRLAESRRRQARDIRMLPIFEFPLLLPTTDTDPHELVMLEDGTVAPT